MTKKTGTRSPLTRLMSLATVPLAVVALSACGSEDDSTGGDDTTTSVTTSADDQSDDADDDDDDAS